MLKVRSYETCYYVHELNAEDEAKVRKFAEEHDCDFQEAVEECMFSDDDNLQIDIWDDYDTVDTDDFTITDVYEKEEEY